MSLQWSRFEGASVYGLIYHPDSSVVKLYLVIFRYLRSVDYKFISSVVKRHVGSMRVSAFKDLST